MTLNEDWEVSWKQKKEIEFDINDNGIIFGDFESAEGAVFAERINRQKKKRNL